MQIKDWISGETIETEDKPWTKVCSLFTTAIFTDGRREYKFRFPDAVAAGILPSSDLEGPAIHFNRKDPGDDFTIEFETQ